MDYLWIILFGTDWSVNVVELGRSMKVSTKQQILSYLEGQDWVSGTRLEYLSLEWETKASTISRRLRELYEDGQLDRKLVKGCVWYKKRPPINWDEQIELERQVDSQLFETAPTKAKGDEK